VRFTKVQGNSGYSSGDEDDHDSRQRLTTRFSILVAVLLAALSAAPGTAAAPPPDRIAALRHGVNLTNWFRFPANATPAALRGYLSDAAIDDLRHAGFTVIRLAVQPEFLDAVPARIALLTETVARLERHGLAVIVVPHPHTWELETHSADRAALLKTWRDLAPALAGLDPDRTFPELLNEPVFHGDEAGWEQLQESTRRVIRAALPSNTIILTGNDWGSIAGLVALPPSPDPNVVYSFHFYDPVELTSLAAWKPGLDRNALARLPFPVSNASTCIAAFGHADSPTREVAAYYCRSSWDAAAIAARIKVAADWAARNHAAVFAGEFGATMKLNRSARLGWLTAVRQACEANGIGWALWGYDDSMGFAITPAPGRRAVLDPGVLTALGLPSANHGHHATRLTNRIGQPSKLR